MARILIPTPLRQFAEKNDNVELPGATVGEVLGALTARFPDLKKHLYNDEGKLRSFVNDLSERRRPSVISTRKPPRWRPPTRFPSFRALRAAFMVAEEVALSKDEILRYSRHLIMPEVGMEGQLKLKLKKASVLLVGAGGLGAPLGLYLTAAGIGRIGMVDFDVVDFTNLQRQVIHGTKDVGRPKLDSAFDSMRDINPFVQLDRHETALCLRARTRSRSSRTTITWSTARTTFRPAIW